MTEDAPQREYSLREYSLREYSLREYSLREYSLREYSLREVFNGLRWINAGCFEAIVHDLGELLRVAQGKEAQPTAVVLDGRTLRSTPESGARAGFDGHKKTKGSKVHIAVDTLGYLLAGRVTAANEQERAQVASLAAKVQEVTQQSVTLAFVDQGYTRPDPAEAAQEQGIALEVVRLPKAKKGFGLLPRRWVVERSFAWATRFRRLAKDYERLPETLAGLHFIVFAILMLTKAAEQLKST